MLKKMMFAGGALALLSSFALGVPIWSYAKCGYSGAKSIATDSVPIEWELKRARQLIDELQPEIRKNARRIADEKIAVNRLQRELETTEVSLVKSKSDISRLHDDLSEGHSMYAYGGRTYTSVQVKADLANRAKRYKTREATVDKLQQQLNARQASLDAAHQQMDAMLNQRRQLEVEVENLQARLSSLRVAQTNSSVNFDDSALARTKELLDSIEARIDVEEETLHINDEYFGGIDLDEPASEDVDALVQSILAGDDADRLVIAD